MQVFYDSLYDYVSNCGEMYRLPFCVSYSCFKIFLTYQLFNDHTTLTMFIPLTYHCSACMLWFLAHIIIIKFYSLSPPTHYHYHLVHIIFILLTSLSFCTHHYHRVHIIIILYTSLSSCTHYHPVHITIILYTSLSSCTHRHS